MAMAGLRHHHTLYGHPDLAYRAGVGLTLAWIPRPVFSDISAGFAFSAIIWPGTQPRLGRPTHTVSPQSQPDSHILGFHPWAVWVAAELLLREFFPSIHSLRQVKRLAVPLP